MAHCSRIDPITYSPILPPLVDQGPTDGQYNAQWTAERNNESAWVTNQHNTGLAISASKLCGEANYVQHGDCTVCGKWKVLRHDPGGNDVRIFGTDARTW